MQQVIQCPKCAQRYQAAAEWAGKTTNCPACGTLIRIPLPQQLTPLVNPLDQPAPFQAPRPEPKPAYAQQQPVYMQQPAYMQPLPPAQPSQGLHPIVWVAIGGGVIAVFFVFTLVIFAMGRSFGTAAATAQAPATGNFDPAVTAGPSSTPATSPPSSSSTITPKPLDTLPSRPITPVRTPRAPVVSPPPTTEATTPLATPTNTSPAPADWGNQEEPKPKPVTTKTPATPRPEVEFGSQILVDERAGVNFGPSGCPVVITGSQVWDLATKKMIAELDGWEHFRGHTSLSPDGNTFAAAGKSPNQQDTEVIVWDTQTGKQKFTVPGNKEKTVDIMHVSDTKLFLGGREDGILEVWDLETGNALKSADLGKVRLNSGKIGFTLDGNYLATPVHDRLTVFRTSTGKMAAYMGSPKGSTGSDPVFVYAWLQSLQFSPDGQELAAVSTHPTTRVMCWDNRGKLIFDQPFQVDHRWDHNLQWFPNRQAWLIEHDIFDRPSGKIVLSIRKPWAQDLYIHVHDDDHLVGTFPGNPHQLEALEIPWEKIRASLEAMKSKEPALLSPSLPVGLLIELGDLRGDKAEVTKLIETSLQDRLKRDGFTLAAGSKTYFRIKFAETAGDQLAIFERQRFEWGRGRDTGRKATESKGDLVVELFVVGRNDPIWRETMKVTSGRSFSEEINDATLRKSMLESAASQIRRLNFPYYIPEAEELTALPIVVQ